MVKHRFREATSAFAAISQAKRTLVARSWNAALSFSAFVNPRWQTNEEARHQPCLVSQSEGSLDPWDSGWHTRDFCPYLLRNKYLGMCLGDEDLQVLLTYVRVFFTQGTLGPRLRRAAWFALTPSLATS